MRCPLWRLQPDIKLSCWLRLPAEDVSDDDDRGRTITPAKVFILGAGVAGLQAIAHCAAPGSGVSAYDVRAAVKEQVESWWRQFVTWM